MKKVNVAATLQTFSEHWQPRIVGELNGQHVKLVKLQGEFVWHQHADEDELFYVVRGSIDIELRDRTVTLGEGEFFIVPRGVEHCPDADEETEVLLIEPRDTVNTGDAGGEMTAEPRVL